MPRVSTKGQVTIPKEIREALGIEPGDEVWFEQTESGYELRKEKPTTTEGEDQFEKYRGSAETDETMPERMRKLRGELPRDVSDEGDEDNFEAHESNVEHDYVERDPNCPLISDRRNEIFTNTYLNQLVDRAYGLRN